MKKMIKLFRYRQRPENFAANSVIYALKRINRSDVREFCIEKLSASISASVADPSKCIFTNIPRRRSAVLKYGMDHSALLARGIALELGAKYLPTLSSKAKRAQKQLSADERKKNAVFAIKTKADLSGKTVILVDDIVTSGASMAEGAKHLRAIGAKEVIGAALAIAYRDDSPQFEFTFF